MVTVAPSRLTLTTTPSIAPSVAELTCPVSAAGACACAGTATDTTVIASNFSSNIAALVLADDNTAPASGNFKLRIVNSAPGLGPADVYIVAPSTNLNTVSPTLGNIVFDSASGYQSLTAGSYEIVVTPVGQKFPAIDTGSLSFSAGQVRTFVGLNSQSGGFSYAMLQDLN